MQLKNISPNRWQLEPISGMKAKVVIYAHEAMIESIQKDRSLSQLAEAAMLPQVISPVIGMPDIHEGFGLPIGGVLATEGLISCGAVGMDINCGVRLLISNVFHESKVFTPDFLRELINKIEGTIPVGVGGRRRESLRGLSLAEIVEGGAQSAIAKGYGESVDTDKIEENGRMDGAKFAALTPLAISRSQKEVGTLGSGNHFIEIQKVAEIYQADLAKKFGLVLNQTCLMLHSGSRALGHQTCVDYTNIFWETRKKYHLEIPTKGLAALPLSTKEGASYFAAMAGAVNFAFANREIMTHFIRQVWEKTFKPLGFEINLTLLYDVAHNIAKWENAIEPKIQTCLPARQGSKEAKILVHRKGATRALPAGHPQNPKIYLGTGHPVIVPGSMGSPSYVLVGTARAAETYYSANHGAGRRMSRSEAFRTISPAEFEKEMAQVIHNKPYRLIADEAPGAYKDINQVVAALADIGLTQKVVRLEPLAVVKGS